MERNFKGVWIPSSIWLDKDLTLQEKAFLTEIDSLDNNEGCFATNSYFSDFFVLSKNRCSEVIKSLEIKEKIKIIYIRNNKCIQKRIIKLSEDSKREFHISEEVRNVEGGIRDIEEGYSENRQGYSEKGEDNNIYNNTINIYNVQFEKFYKSYPKKQSKELTKKWFDKNKITDERFDEIISKLELFKTHEWNKSNIKFIPMPITWLNQKRWEDEIIVNESTNEEKKEYEFDPELVVQKEKRRGIYGGQ